MKQLEYEKVRALRRMGLSVTEILGKVKVARGSVCRWTRDIKLTKEQDKGIRVKSGLGQLKGARANYEKGLERRIQYQRDGIEKSKHCDADYRCGCMLYWCEGNKAVGSVGVSNTDASLLKIFVRFIKKYFAVKDSDFSLKVMAHLNNGLTVNDIHNYWLSELSLPKSCLRKFILKTKYYPNINTRGNKHIYGCCTVQIHSTRIMQTIYGSIQELFKIHRPEWVRTNK